MPPEERFPDVAHSITNATQQAGPRVKTLKFRTFQERLDFIHDNMEPTLRTVVIMADDLFKDDRILLDEPDCRFRLSFESETRVGAGRQKYKLEPNFDADIELPNLEHRWKVYLRSHSRDSITDREEEDDGRATRLGVSRFREDLNIEADAGLRLRVKPEAYTRLQWSQRWSPQYWVIKPAERLFYETDKGFGELTMLGIHRWLGRRPRAFVQSVSQLEMSESSEGYEFDQAFRVGRLWESLEPLQHWSSMLGDRAMAKGLVFRAGLNGHSEGETTVDGYRVGVLYRKPVYKKWIYLSTNPDVLWERDQDWKTEFRLRLSLDMLFWGSIER